VSGDEKGKHMKITKRYWTKQIFHRYWCL